MPKITSIDIQELGFSEESFVGVTDFAAFVDGIIAEQADLLAARIGDAAYASTTRPISTYVARAEKSLVAAELYQRRFNAIAQDISSADGMDAFKLRRTQEGYAAEAERLIEQIRAGAGTDGGFSFGTVISSHFPEDASA